MCTRNPIATPTARVPQVHFTDAELDGFVDGLARRIASFDRRAIAGFFDKAMALCESMPKPVIAATSPRARTRDWANPKSGWECTPVAAVRNASHILVGRGRALEIILGANDFDGDIAERYGYVNRALAAPL